MSNPTRVLCDHGYVLMQDSCPNCDAAADTPHTATPVMVRVPWSKRPLRRCTACALVPSHHIHH